MFYLVIIFVCTLLLWGWLAYGPRWALAVGWGMTILAPVWFGRTLGPLALDTRMIVCLFLMGLVALTAAVRWGGRWLLLDGLMVALVGSLMISHTLGDRLSPAVLWSIFSGWMLPYVLGRLTFQTIAEFRSSLWVAAGVCLVLFLLSMSESITKVNFVTAIASRGASYGFGAQYRWGLKRATGPLTHPIYFGLLLVMLLPWALEAYWLVRQRVAVPRWWLWTPVLLAGAIFFSMSRGPQMALIVALYGVVVYLVPRWRSHLIALGVAGVLMLAVGREVAWDALHVWSTEASEPERQMLMQIDGEYVRYSGTNHRWLQVLVYRRALEDAGAFGFGQLQTAVDLYVPGELQKFFKSIDNQYLFMIVTCGYVGTGLFLGVAGCAMIYMVRMLQQMPRSEGRVVAANLAALVAVMLTMLTVWFASDYGYLWLFNVGMAGSWYAHWNDQREHAHRHMWSVQRPAPPVRRRRRLVPGHLPTEDLPSYARELTGSGARQLSGQDESLVQRLLPEANDISGTAPDVSADEA